MDDIVKGAAEAQAVAALTAAVDDLLALRLSSLPARELPELGRAVEAQLRRLPAFDHAWITELERRDVPAELGTRSVAAVLVDTLRIAPGHARTRVKAARNLGPRLGFGGEPLPPLFPLVVAAQASGAISVEHAQVVTDTIDALPHAAQAEHSTAVEAVLVEQAHDFHPATLRGLAQHLRDHLDPDGTLADEHDRRRLRELTLTTRSDGSGHLTGELTAGCTVTWQTILDALAAPKPAADGERDARTAAQRRHDAFHDAGQRLLRVGDLPDCGGTPATVLITMTLADLETRTGLATTEHGGATSIDTALQITAEADVIPVTVNDMGGVLAYGRRRRTASPAQRLALAARDGGCSFPGCDSPPAWTQAHHVIPWADGGRIDLDNLTLVCGFHHREFERVGWRCDIYDRVPWWTPPAWIDPTRTPRRNHTHHLARLLPHPPVGPLKINQARGEPVCLRSWPDTVLPDTVLPDTLLPDPLLPDPLLPDTVLPDTLLPDTLLPDTVLPDTLLPDTLLPDTVLPDTLLPDTPPTRNASAGPCSLDRLTDAASQRTWESLLAGLRP